MTDTPRVPLKLAEPALGVRTHCPYCAFQCGILMGEDLGGGLPRVTGDPHFPVNNGQLCIKGWTSGALLGHPQRVTCPQLRDPGGTWRDATWAEAFDFVAAKMAALRERYGPDANGVFGSGALTNEKAYLLGKFARVALGTANIDYNGRFCMSSAAAAQTRAFGIDRGLPFPVADVERAEVVMLVGANTADTLPPMMQWFDRQKAAGGRLVVADPRRTATARRADLFLQLTPGTDLALANGLLYVALEERLTDERYIAERTTGFDAVRRAVLQYHPAHVERLTGVPESQLRRAARWLATARSAMVLSGRGTEQHSKGVDSVHAWINLVLALGKVGAPNSGFGTLTGQGNGQGGREHGQKADQLPGYRLIEVDAHRAAVANVWGVEPASLPRKGKSATELLNALGSEVRGLFVMGSNVAVAAPHAERVEQGLKALDLLVVCDAFHNETSAHAHVFLPVFQWAEEDGTMTNLEGRVIRRRVVSRPPTGPLSDLEILREIADRLGCGAKFAFRDTEAVFDELRRATAGAPADYSGITYAKIDAADGVCWPCPTEDHPGTPLMFTERFHHADGRARFFAVDHRTAGEEPDAEFPLFFTTGRYKEHYNSGAQTRQVAKLHAAQPVPRLEMHPRLARRHRVVTGSRVTVESRRARVEFAAEVTADIRADTLFAPFHWGGRAAANLLTSGHLDPTSRMPEFKLTAVRIAGVRHGS
ncbi:molybdopterin oxidoreductase family protein [Frigoriglobus tundricola]|uniref:Assimilatory nitrate reductase large subunit n=1 Tax=Frigoriglobus tundricola TaxID=2774151 RepID=A0A6M5YTJ6_9BACT|nr:molybdopterin oxidoreductase family protein [Frigoriglobus tundricola]QJW97395.1 Assimilatory nitrate reductase large subunit [Frigoriglobus tundricola]